MAELLDSGARREFGNGAVRDVKLRFRSAEVKFEDINEADVSINPFGGAVETYPSKMNHEEFRSNSEFESEF